MCVGGCAWWGLGLVLGCLSMSFLVFQSSQKRERELTALLILSDCCDVAVSVMLFSSNCVIGWSAV